MDAGIAGRERTKAWVQTSDEGNGLGLHGGRRHRCRHRTKATVLDCGGLGLQSWTASEAMAKATVLGLKLGAEVLRGALEHLRE